MQDVAADPYPHWLELKPGHPWCSPEQLNRLLRQQGLCLAVAQAAVYDEIAQAIALPLEQENALIHSFLTSQGVHSDDALANWLTQKGWNQADLRYFATKGERLEHFKQRFFAADVELRFLERKLDLDQVVYSLLRVRDEALALELHQRLIEAEADFASLAAAYSEGGERLSNGLVGPVSLTQAHPAVAAKLRVSQPGQLWEPFFLVDIWLILRLEHWQPAELNEATRAQLRDDLFVDWLQQRVAQLLSGETPPPLPQHLLESQ